MTTPGSRRAAVRHIVTAAALLLTGTGVLAQTVVKIGCVLPLSGGSAAVGNQTLLISTQK